MLDNDYDGEIDEDFADLDRAAGVSALREHWCLRMCG